MADPNNSALENARKRARRRLVGAVVLALAAAVVLPMFLESDPRPLGPDVQIQIPAIDDAKFQNRLTPDGTSKASIADKTGPPAPSEPAKAPRETTGAVTGTAPATGAAAPGSAVAPIESPASASAPAASKPDETSPTTSLPQAAAVKQGAAKPTSPATSPVVAALSATPTKKSVSSTSPSAATPPAASPTAAAPPVAAPAKKLSAAPPGPETAPPAAPAPAAALPAFSLTATAPPLGTAPAPDPQSEPPPAPAAAEGQFVVQLGAYIDTAAARDLAARAGEQGFSAFLEAVTTKSGQVQRVRVGPFATRGEADAAAVKLKGAGFTAVARPR